MAEITINPTDLKWMGQYKDLPKGPFEIGWAFFADFSCNDLNPAFDRSIREPITVICPVLHHWEDGSYADCVAGIVFTIDRMSSPEEGEKQPWDVKVDLDSLIIGQKPNITIHPSIHLVNIWHGWLQEGVLHQ